MPTYALKDIAAETQRFAQAKGAPETFLDHMRGVFPGITGEEIAKSLRIQRDSKRIEAEQLMDSARELDAIHEGRATMASAESPQARLNEALVRKAYELHPDWEPTEFGSRWIGVGSPRAVVADADMIDWLQRTHPRVASAIEAQFDPA
jgi:hypothetical protein